VAFDFESSDVSFSSPKKSRYSDVSMVQRRIKKTLASPSYRLDHAALSTCPCVLGWSYARAIRGTNNTCSGTAARVRNRRRRVATSVPALNPHDRSVSVQSRNLSPLECDSLLVTTKDRRLPYRACRFSFSLFALKMRFLMVRN